jgi:hypothetical protein
VGLVGWVVGRLVIEDLAAHLAGMPAAGHQVWDGSALAVERKSGIGGDGVQSTLCVCVFSVCVHMRVRVQCVYPIKQICQKDLLCVLVCVSN